MITLDINPPAGLQLVANEGLTDIAYVALPAGPHPTITPISIVYLKQAHYCARVKGSGLILVQEKPMLPGWQVWDHSKRMLGDLI